MQFRIVVWLPKGFNLSTLTEYQRAAISYIKVKEYEKKVWTLQGQAVVHKANIFLIFSFKNVSLKNSSKSTWALYTLFKSACSAFCVETWLSNLNGNENITLSVIFINNTCYFYASHCVSIYNIYIYNNITIVLLYCYSFTK